MICEKCGREKNDNGLCVCEMNVIRGHYDVANKGLNDIFVSPVMMLTMFLIGINIFLTLASVVITSGDTTSNIITAIILVLPNSFLLYGLFKLFDNGKQGIIPINTSGFVIISKLLKVMRGMMIVALVLCVFGTISLLSVGEEKFSESMEVPIEYFFPDEATLAQSLFYTLIIVCYIIIDVTLTIVVIFMKKMIKALSNVMKVATGNVSEGVSMVLVVLLFGSGAITMVSSLMYLEKPDMFSFVAFLLSGSINICFGILVLKMRNVVNRLKESLTV